MLVKRILKIAGIVFTIFLAGLLVVFLCKEKQEEQDIEARYAEMEKELLPLDQESNRLKRELEALEKEYTKKSKGLGSVVFLFTNLDQTVYTDIYPLMEKYDFVGMLALSAGQMPDKEGCLTQEQFKELMDAGWKCCLKWEEGASTRVWLSACDKLVKDIGIDRPEVVYFPEDTYSSDMDPFLRQQKFSVAVHHGEEDRPLIQTETEGDIRHQGAMGWNQRGASQMLSEAMTRKGDLVFTIGKDSSEEEYVQDAGERMLARINVYCELGELLVMDAMEVKEYRGKLENDQAELTADYQMQKTELEEQIEKLKNKTDEIIDGYMIEPD